MGRANRGNTTGTSALREAPVSTSSADLNRWTFQGNTIKEKKAGRPPNSPPKALFKSIGGELFGRQVRLSETRNRAVADLCSSKTERAVFDFLSEGSLGSNIGNSREADLDEIMSNLEGDHKRTEVLQALYSMEEIGAIDIMTRAAGRRYQLVDHFRKDMKSRWPSFMKPRHEEYKQEFGEDFYEYHLEDIDKRNKKAVDSADREIEKAIVSYLADDNPYTDDPSRAVSKEKIETLLAPALDMGSDGREIIGSLTEVLAMDGVLKKVKDTAGNPAFFIAHPRYE